MSGTLKFAHLLGLALFGGTIAVYIAAPHVAGADLGALVAARQIIRTGTLVLTVPGLWLAVLTGALIAWRRGLGRRPPPWLVAKLGLVAGIVLNTHALIVPATGAALVAARQSLALGSLNAAYHRADQIETVAGACNVLALFAVIALVVFRPRFRGRVARAT